MTRFTALLLALVGCTAADDAAPTDAARVDVGAVDAGRDLDARTPRADAGRDQDPPRPDVRPVPDARVDAGAERDAAPRADAAPDPDAAPPRAGPAPGIAWHWQLQGQIDPELPVGLYDVDLFDVPDALFARLRERGVFMVCYFSAGSYEEWRADAGRFPPGALGQPLDGWPGERWLDVRSEAVREVMRARLDLAARRGCDAVEPDNVDGYVNQSGFALGAAEQLDYNRFLAAEAHARGLQIALKNAVELIPELAPLFDFAVNEECFEFSECDALRPFIDANKAVLQVEYADAEGGARRVADRICADARARRFSTLVLPWDLDASFRVSCD